MCSMYPTIHPDQYISMFTIISWFQLITDLLVCLIYFSLNVTKSETTSLLPFQNKCTQPEDVKLCTLILRPATAGPQRKKVVSFLTPVHWCSNKNGLFLFTVTSLSCLPHTNSCLTLLSSLQSSIHTFIFLTMLPSLLSSFLPLCVSDPSKGGGGSPTRSGAGSVPAPDRAEPGSSSSSCFSTLLPHRTSQDLPGHLSWTCPGSSLHRDTIGPDASSPHPRGRHEGPWGMEGAQRRQREMGDHKREGEREAVTAEGAEGDTDACYCARWAEGSNTD